MGDIVIDLIDPANTEPVVHLYNQVFRPERDAEFFNRRLQNRVNPLVMMARIEDEAVGFFIGMELKPSVFFAWLVGVPPDARRQGVGSHLMRSASDWARERDYRFIRFECYNHQRTMMHFGIAEGYDIIGLRWDPDSADNLVIFEKRLAD